MAGLTPLLAQTSGRIVRPTSANQGSLVLAWNAAMLQAVRADCTAPPLAVRNLAIMHRTLESALKDPVSAPVIGAVAACESASLLFPGRKADFERLRDYQLSLFEGAVMSNDWARARALAAQCLNERNADEASGFVNYVPKVGAGEWRRTPPFFRPPELPQWPGMRPFVIADPSRFLPSGPPDLDSMRWKTALNEIRQIGARNSTERTPEQRQIAMFWSDFSYTCTPPGHWNEIAADLVRTHHLNDIVAAQLFSVLNMAMADAGVVCWQAKYRYNFWRPVTALEAEDWSPLLNTPSHPEYPSGHSSFSGAAATVLAAFFGDGCVFTARSDTVTGVTRTFHSFSAAADEISQSRIYAGIHYRFSCDDGLVLGRAVATEVLRVEPLLMVPASQAKEFASR